MNPADSAIRIADLTVRYGRKTAVDGVSFAVPGGSVYALLGRNGAGKSSLVRCLVGQQKPNAGGVALFGEDVWKRRAALMDRVGVVSEEADAPPEMRVAALARFSAKLYRSWNQDAVDERLKRFGIAASSRYGDLSKGQKKQVALAMALAPSPELLILDDPTLGLDVVARKVLFEEVIAELADRGITVLLTTHDLGGIEGIADRVGILRDGRLVLDEEMEALKSRFRRVRFPSQPAAFSDATLKTAAVRAWGGGTEAVVSNYDELAFERFRSASSLNAAEVAPLSLEDIFIAVTGEGVQS
ncbi:MAG: ABC transporter ATP-binding protein [Acidobacteria bacterium]|nr:ABC transporter ATP-binding protein [Acidobacteriota bacterium]